VSVLKIPHVYPSDNTPLHLEANLRATRQAVWLSVFLAEPLPYPELAQRARALLRDVDHLLAELDL
jgi:hypothetical protein